MKNAFFCIRNISLALIVLSNSLYAHNEDITWKECAEIGLTVAAAAAIGYGMYKCLSTESDENNEARENHKIYDKHDAELNVLRLKMRDNQQGIEYDMVDDKEDDITTLEELEQHKQALRKKWISNYLFGMPTAWSLSLAGTKSASTIHCTHLQSSGDGFIDNSVVKETTILGGNHIVTKSRLSGTLTIESAAQMVSFNRCILDEITQKGKERSIIELSSTAVKSDIKFRTFGVVVIDKDSLIGGQVINGKIVKKR